MGDHDPRADPGTQRPAGEGRVCEDRRKLYAIGLPKIDIAGFAFRVIGKMFSVRIEASAQTTERSSAQGAVADHPRNARLQLSAVGRSLVEDSGSRPPKGGGLEGKDSVQPQH